MGIKSSDSHAAFMEFTFEFIVFCDNLERIFGLMYHNPRKPNKTWVFTLNDCYKKM